MRECTEDLFLKDVTHHTMTIAHNEGLYRHLQFRKPGTRWMWFDLITFPGCLVIQGDMGTYVFNRLLDMFEFFRSDRDINPGYWGEKLTASDGNGSYPNFRRFSFDLFKNYVQEHFESIVENCELGKTEAADLKIAVDEMLEDIPEDDERRAYETVNDFSYRIDGRNIHFSDSWEWRCRDYTYHFLWCCYAIKWGIQQYDAVHKMDGVVE